MVQQIGTPSPASGGFNPVPTGRLHHNDVQVIPQGVPTIITLDVISNGVSGGYDYGNHFNDGIEDTVNHWIKPEVEGWYQVNAQVRVFIEAGDVFTFQLFRGPGSIAAKTTGQSETTKSLHISDIVWMSVVDYVLLKAYHTAATACSITGSPGRYDSTFMSVQRVR